MIMVMEMIPNILNEVSVGDNYINTGKEMLDKEIRRRKLSFSEVLTDENINKVHLYVNTKTKKFRNYLYKRWISG